LNIVTKLYKSYYVTAGAHHSQTACIGYFQTVVRPVLHCVPIKTSTCYFWNIKNQPVLVHMYIAFCFSEISFAMWYKKVGHTLRGLLPILLLGEQRHDGCEQFAQDCYPTASRLRFEPGPFSARVQHANRWATEPPPFYTVSQ